jgi:superfamily II DNA or RNA helicase
MVTSRREVEQAVGRVIRKIDPNVRPMIYDFTDMLPSFVNQGYNRRKLYKKMGFEIKIIETKNGEIINTIQSEETNKLKECIDDVECEFID